MDSNNFNKCFNAGGLYERLAHFIERKRIKFKVSQFIAYEEFNWGVTAPILKQLKCVCIL